MGLHWRVKTKCLPAGIPHRGGRNLNVEDYFLKSKVALELFSCFNLPPLPTPLLNSAINFYRCFQFLSVVGFHVLTLPRVI